MKLGRRLVDRVIWSLYLAAMGMCAYAAWYAWVVERWPWMWAGIGGWVVSTAWGLFFRLYVMAPQGKRRKPRGKGRVGRGTEIIWDPVLGWMHRAYEGKPQWLTSWRGGRDI